MVIDQTPLFSWKLKDVKVILDYPKCDERKDDNRMSFYLVTLNNNQ